MPLAWRIVKARRAAATFSGEGAARTGGRWNSRGVRVIYASSTKALAALETLVHLNPPILFKYVAFRIEFDAALVSTLSSRTLPRDWSIAPAGPAPRAIGDAWVEAAAFAVLAVPSIIIPGETNYLLNPAHPKFRKIFIAKPKPFAFDPRLLR